MRIAAVIGLRYIVGTVAKPRSQRTLRIQWGRLSEMCPKNPILLLHHVSWFRTSIGFLAGPTGYYGVVLARCIKMRCILCLGPLVLKHPIFASKELPLQRGVVGSEFTPAKARVAVR